MTESFAITWTKRAGFRGAAVYEATGDATGDCLKLSFGWSASGQVPTPDGAAVRLVHAGGHKSAVAAMRAFERRAAELYAMGNA